LKILLCGEVLSKLLDDKLLKSCDLLNETWEVGGSKQQQIATSRASPAGRCPASWIFVERLVEKHVLILIRNSVIYVLMSSDELAPGNWANELMPGNWTDELLPGNWTDELVPGNWVDELVPGNWMDEHIWADELMPGKWPGKLMPGNWVDELMPNNWTDELAPDIWENGLVSLMRD